MLDGLYALPNQNPQACEHRDEFACVGVQLQAGAVDSRRETTTRRDPGVSGAFMHAKIALISATNDASGMLVATQNGSASQNEQLKTKRRWTDAPTAALQ